MPDHRITMHPTTPIDLGSVDIIITVDSGGEKLGELRMSRGSIEWFPRNHLYATSLTWERFSDVMDSAGLPRPSNDHTGKYRPLWEHLRTEPSHRRKMRFADIERILGFSLPASSRKHLPHWYGYDGSAVARAVIDAGWKATQVDLNAQTVVFVRR